jgi:exosortase/archaeosortase family protein
LPDASPGRGLRFVVGLLLAGYGLLVLLDVLAHEAEIWALGLLVVGIGLLWTAARPRSGTEPATSPSHEPAPAADGEATSARVAGTLGLGLLSAGGVVTYNALAGSTFTLPELAILAYGTALVLAAPHLETRWGPIPVASLVAWSLPLVAAPLGVYALDAALDAGAGSSPLDAFIRHVLVPPMTATLDLLGFDVARQAQTVSLGTPRGTLFLTVGLVCAGLQPGILFLGVLGLHLWREATPPKQAGLLLAAGAVSVYLMNLARLVLLAVVGHRWGGSALQTAHAHAGWALFLVLVLAFWGLVLPRLEAAASAEAV